MVKWPKTPPFHGGNTGSTPVRVTKKEIRPLRDGFFFLATLRVGEPVGFVEAVQKPRQAFGTVESRAARIFRAPPAAVEKSSGAEYPVKAKSRVRLLESQSLKISQQYDII